MREDKLKYLLEIYRENERKIKELEQIKSHISVRSRSASN